jgi:hypothetical protein
MSTTTTKLTLSVETAFIEEAKRLAIRRRTSVSAMFTAFLKSLAQTDNTAQTVLGPVTQKASGIVKLPRGRSDEQLVEEALSARYRTAR